MQIQKSFSGNQRKGQLYLVGTPIGNLEDMTYRAVRILQEVDLIAAEDTRQTRKLLTHFDIHTPLHSYHEHNKEQSAEQLLSRLDQGQNIALVSDAGMPAISDPGYELVAEAVERDISVIPIPGPNAALSALVCSGLPTNRFLFIGFMARTKKPRKAAFEQLLSVQDTMLFYESPHRLKEFLRDAVEVLGDRRISIARELTKKFEEWFRGTITEAIVWAEEGEPRGEFCVVIEGSAEETGTSEAWWSHLTIEQHVEVLVEQGQAQKDAIKQAAKERKLPKREVYDIIHVK